MDFAVSIFVVVVVVVLFFLAVVVGWEFFAFVFACVKLKVNFLAKWDNRKMTKHNKACDQDNA